MASSTKRTKLDLRSSKSDNSVAKDEDNVESTSSVNSCETDLPLLANYDQVKVLHYLLKLHFQMNKKAANGVCVYFLEPKQTCREIVLDANKLKIHKVQLLRFTNEYELPSSFHPRHFALNAHTDWFSISENVSLDFEIDQWSVRCHLGSLLASNNQLLLPSVIRIQYDVLESSESLTWCPAIRFNYSQSEVKCVYTAGSAINNRGLFPCQENPSAMATWECLLSVDHWDYECLMSSDEVGLRLSRNLDKVNDDKTTKWSGNCDSSPVCYYFYSSHKLPMSTFALVVSKFPFKLEFTVNISIGEESEKGQNSSQESATSSTPVRLLGVSDEEPIIDRTNPSQFKDFMRRTLAATYKLLGKNPFPRVDLVVLPRIFHALGFCSPHLIFLSPSIFHGVEPMYHYRIPHELAHNWFGLLIGAMDWAEEFLSEGFATFLELLLYAEIFPNAQTELTCKSCLILLTLQNELQNTSSELHVMSQRSGDEDPGEQSGLSIKNGLQPIKPFMQVHYLKGYLLLHYCSSLVDEHDGSNKEFLKFLKGYVEKFQGSLVTAKMFLEFFCNEYRDGLEVEPNFVERVTEEWLRSENMPAEYSSFSKITDELPEILRKSFPLLQSLTQKLCEAVASFENNFSNCNYEENDNLYRSMSASEKVLFLEHILNISRGNKKQRKTLYKALSQSKFFEFELNNPEILHRICELIILNEDMRRVSMIENFLLKFQSLGLYLYGELMISEKSTFQKLARKLYYEQESALEMAQKKLLHEMIF